MAYSFLVAVRAARIWPICSGFRLLSRTVSNGEQLFMPIHRLTSVARTACLDFVNGAAQKFGRVDILINNAGIRKHEKVDGPPRTSPYAADPGKTGSCNRAAAASS